MRKPTVFVVDDDYVVRLGIVKRLTRQHFTVRDFDSGEAILNFIKVQKDVPDVILLDYQMPGMNGLETLKAIRKKVPDVPAVILTAYGGSVNMETAKKLGAYRVVTKTVELDGLVQVVNGALAVQKLQRTEFVKIWNQGAE